MRKIIPKNISLLRRVLPDVEGANWAAAPGYLHVLQFLASRGIWLVRGANWANDDTTARFLVRSTRKKD